MVEKSAGFRVSDCALASPGERRENTRDPRPVNRGEKGRGRLGIEKEKECNYVYFLNLNL